MKKTIPILIIMILSMFLTSCNTDNKEFESKMYSLNYNPTNQEYGEMFYSETEGIYTSFIKNMSTLEIYNLETKKKDEFYIPENFLRDNIQMQNQKLIAGYDDLKVIIYENVSLEERTIGFIGVENEEVIFQFNLLALAEFDDVYESLDIESFAAYPAGNGNIIIVFNNQGSEASARILQIDPITQEVINDYSINEGNLVVKDVYENMIFLWDSHQGDLKVYDVFSGEKLYELDFAEDEGFSFSGPGMVHEGYYYTVNRLGIYKTKISDSETEKILDADLTKYINGNGTDFRDIFVESDDVIYISVANNFGADSQGDPMEDLTFVKYCDFR